MEVADVDPSEDGGAEVHPATSKLAARKIAALGALAMGSR
jgi:hypothetical protein